MEPPLLLDQLKTAKLVYGTLAQLTDLNLISVLNQISCTLILRKPNSQPTNPELTKLYRGLFPVEFNHFAKLNPQLQKRERVPSEAIYTIDFPLPPGFLILENESQVKLWICLDNNRGTGLLNTDPAVIEDFREEFFELLCRSSRLEDSLNEPFRYHYMKDELSSWQILERREHEGSDATSRLAQILADPSVQLAGQLVYSGISLAIETRYPHLILTKRALDKVLTLIKLWR